MNDSDFQIVIKEEATPDFEIYGNGFVGGIDLPEKQADSKKGPTEIKAELLEFHNLYRRKVSLAIFVTIWARASVQLFLTN